MECTHALDLFESNLIWFTGEVARRAEYADLGGIDFDPYLDAQRRVSHLIGRLKRVHAELGELRRHTHQWGENDYCRICGADGRA